MELNWVLGAADARANKLDSMRLVEMNIFKANEVLLSRIKTFDKAKNATVFTFGGESLNRDERPFL
jgi:hypothetical protein